jgi:hypothetical protein
LGVDGVHIAEVTGQRIGNGARLPGLAPISRMDKGAFGATNPDHIRPGYANRPKAGVGANGLWLPLTKGRKRSRQQAYKQA